MSLPIISLVFHGNCIDGWFSAYVAYMHFKNLNNEYNINFYPISPNLSFTWPSSDTLRNTNVVITDVMVPDTTFTLWKSIALSILCIDHHATSKSLCEANSHICIHDTSACATLLTWHHFFQGYPVPDWIYQIDRIDRWDGVTDDDRVMREVLHPIALLPVNGMIDEAINESAHYVIAASEWARTYAPSYMVLLKEKGEKSLRVKEAHLTEILKSGSVITVSADNATAWGLHDDWVGKTGFIINTTGVTLDSTEAGFMALNTYTDAEFFINYRLKTYVRRDGFVEKTYIYSARARDGFDLTKGSILAGHPCAAGASRMMGEGLIPFVM
jgi:hypothetical protein